MKRMIMSIPLILAIISFFYCSTDFLYANGSGINKACLEGNELIKQNKYNEALKKFKLVLSKRPDDLAANIGHLECIRRVEPEKLLIELEKNRKRAERKPNDAISHYLLAKTYLELYQWTLSLWPKKGLVPDDLVDKANIYRKGFDTEIAKSIELDPSLIEAYDAVIDKSLIYGELKRATEAMEKILAFKPEDIEANLQMANLCFSQMAVDPWTARPEFVNKTIKYSKKVLSMDPENDNAIYYLASAYMQGGHYEKAIPLFEKCLELDPDKDSQGAELCRLWINKMKTDIKEGKRRKMIRLYE